MIEKQPYVNYTLDEDRVDDKGETINVRLNADERERLDRLKYFLHEPKDSTTLKYALELAENVVHGLFSEASWLRLCSETRRKGVIKRPKSLEK